MTVQYSCELCGLRRVPCQVEERAADEDLGAWMEALGHTLSRDHARRSPACHPKTLTELLIPMTGRTHVGGPIVQ